MKNLHVTVYRQNYDTSYNLNHFTWPKTNNIFTIHLIFPLKISLMKILMPHCCSFKAIKILSIVHLMNIHIEIRRPLPEVVKGGKEGGK
mgnify:CR=1 FL=1